MKVNLSQNDIYLLIDSLYSYQLEIEHGTDNGYEYHWTEDNVMKLVKKLTKFVEVENKIAKVMLNRVMLFMMINLCVTL